MTNKKEYNTAFFLHLSAFFGYVFPFGSVIAPLVIWELKKNESDFIDQSGKAAVNFNLSFLLYSFILGISIFPFAFNTFFTELAPFDLFGFLSMISLVGILAVIRFILVITAATRANNGEIYDYPITIKFIK